MRKWEVEKCWLDFGTTHKKNTLFTEISARHTLTHITPLHVRIRT